MAFDEQQAEQLLVDTGRRCCLCRTLHKVQLHHIVSKNDGGTDDIENAIPLCPNCHDEVHGRYSHGRTTRSYTSNELSLHRQKAIERRQKETSDIPLWNGVDGKDSIREPISNIKTKSMDMVVVVILREMTGVQYEVELPIDAKVAQITRVLLPKLELPTTCADGTLLNFKMFSKTRGIQLNDDKSFRDNGVKQGEILILRAEICAG